MIDPFRNLDALRNKVDCHSARIMADHADQFACKAGCSSCCQTDRTVSDVEYAALQSALGALPPTQRAALGKGKGCTLLVDNRCALYAERPLICRSHGLPILVADGLDVCPLNFVGNDISKLPEADVMAVSTVDTILAAVNMLYCKEQAGDPRRRRPLKQLLKP